MSDRPAYKIKPRPNLFDLAIMDGFLCGGGNQTGAQREAYWATSSENKADIKTLNPSPKK